jgi:hypothetical protein
MSILKKHTSIEWITCSIVVVIINGGSLSTEYAVGALGGNVNAFFNRGKYTRLITRY